MNEHSSALTGTAPKGRRRSWVDIGGTYPRRAAPILDAVRGEGDDATVIRDEVSRLTTWEERHRRLVSRLAIVLLLTMLVDVAGTVLIYATERNVKGGDIHSLGDALFFTTVQLLTVSSQIRNPLTATGRLVDVVLEVWAVIVVAGSAGAIASFVQAGDS